MAQTAGVFEGANYLLHVPAGYDDTADPWPVILFLHGAGERGADVWRVKRQGLPKHVERRAQFPFIVLSPQCPEGVGWQPRTRGLMALLDSILARHRADPARVYLTGISLGGYGTWHAASRHPQRFAAIAPICGGGLKRYGFPEKACALAEVPIWAFHGLRDEVVPPEETVKLIEVVRRCGGDPRLTLYEDAAHDSWTRTYANPTLYRWFLSHRSDATRSVRPSR